MTNIQTPKEIYASLAGNVDGSMVQRIFQGFSAALNEGVETVHLLLHSTGGLIGDGIGIYNYLSKLPLRVIAYNGGTVSSIAVLVFLAAKQRKASRTATFTLHKSQFTSTVPATHDSLQGYASMLKIDDGRIEAIVREHVTMPPEKWQLHEKADLTILVNLRFEVAQHHGDCVGGHIGEGARQVVEKGLRGHAGCPSCQIVRWEPRASSLVPSSVRPSVWSTTLGVLFLTGSPVESRRAVPPSGHPSPWPH